MASGIDKKKPTPIFIFSLPRSGSTMLQKMLMQSEDVASVSEPWILLPLMQMRKEEGTLSVYNHNLSSRAITDFISAFPNKDDDYNELLREFVLGLYDKLSKNKKYFIDKTPRYYHIIKEINELFPEAKFIFLVRDPRDIYSSLLHNGRNNSFKITYNLFDNFSVGARKLAEGYTLLKRKAIKVNYEDLVIDSELELKRITDYIGIANIDKVNPSSSPEELSGSMGDKIGAQKYSEVSVKSVGKWKETFNSRFRKKVLYRSMNDIDDMYFKNFEKSKENVIHEIKLNKTSFSFSYKDVIYYYRSRLIYRYKLNVFFGGLYKWVRKNYIS